MPHKRNTKRILAMRFRHRQFLKLYLGSTPIAGNANQCYRAVYGEHLSVHGSQACASKLLAKPHIQAAIKQAEQAAQEQLALDASFVLKENLRLYQRAMGDEAYDHAEVDIDPDTGEERVTVTQTRSYDPATAHKALQSIGQHRDVQAFAVTVEHNHTHVLEQRLAARSKFIEGQAQVITDQATDLVPGQLPDLAADPDQVSSNQVPADGPISARYVAGDEDINVHAAEPGAGTEAPTAAHAERGSIDAEVNPARSAHNEVPAREREGATAE
jgi:hypothetical protein